MSHPASEPDFDAAPSDVMFRTLFGFLMPFLMAGAPNDPELVQDAIVAMIEAYQAATLQELDLVGRIIAFSLASLESLRLSMQPELSDAKRLRYQGSGVNLSKCSDRCQAMLDKLQASRPKLRPAAPNAVAGAGAATPVAPEPAAAPPPAARTAMTDAPLAAAVPVAARPMSSAVSGAPAQSEIATPPAGMVPALQIAPEPAAPPATPNRPATQPIAHLAPQPAGTAPGRVAKAASIVDEIDMEALRRETHTVIESLAASGAPLLSTADRRFPGSDCPPHIPARAANG